MHHTEHGTLHRAVHRAGQESGRGRFRRGTSQGMSGEPAVGQTQSRGRACEGADAADQEQCPRLGGPVDGRAASEPIHAGGCRRGRDRRIRHRRSRAGGSASAKRSSTRAHEDAREGAGTRRTGRDRRAPHRESGVGAEGRPPSCSATCSTTSSSGSRSGTATARSSTRTSPDSSGSRYTLGDDDLAALDAGVIKADVSDLSKPENRFEHPQGKLLEVYLPIRAPNGQRLLFEGYFRYSAVSSSGARIWRSFAPISLGALVALELVQLPLAWSLARRLRQRQREREGLLQQALDASDTRTAPHRGRHPRRRRPEPRRGRVHVGRRGADATTSSPPPRSSWATRPTTCASSVKALRSLLVEIYPPNLFDEGLVPALTDLIARADGKGIATTLDDEGLHGSPPAAVVGSACTGPRRKRCATCSRMRTRRR